jgi:nucleoid DNA-binding protein/LysM repeat protein
MEKLTLLDIAKLLTQYSGIPQDIANPFVTTLFEVVQSGLERDQIVKIKGLGTFKIIGVEARESVNVNTGERVVIESHGKITFAPDSTMKEIVNKPFSQFETVVLNDGVSFDDLATSSDGTTEDEAKDGINNEYDSSDSDDVDEKESEEFEVNQQVGEDDNEKIESVMPDGGHQSSDDVPPIILEGRFPVEDMVVEDKSADNDSDDEKTVDQISEDTNLESETVIPNQHTFPESEEKPLLQTKEVGEQYLQEDQNDHSDVTNSDVNEHEESVSGVPESMETDSDNIEQNVEEDNSIEEKHIGKWILYVLLSIVFVALAYFGGYKYGESCALRNVKRVAPIQKTVVKATSRPAAQKTTPAKTDTLLSSEKSVAEKDIKEAENIKQSTVAPEEDTWRKYDKMDVRLHTGAYGIVGTAKVIKVKAGETVNSISRRTLGPDMECYIEVFNGLTGKTLLTEGQRLKIPKLELKRHLKKKENL